MDLKLTYKICDVRSMIGIMGLFSSPSNTFTVLTDPTLPYLLPSSLSLSLYIYIYLSINRSASRFLLSFMYLSVSRDSGSAPGLDMVLMKDLQSLMSVILILINVLTSCSQEMKLYLGICRSEGPVCWLGSKYVNCIFCKGVRPPPQTHTL